MRQRMNYYKIGLFVISSIFIVSVFIIILGAGNLFQKNLILETYFDESIQGLDVGSIVKFRGVKIGTVKEITFVQDKYKLDADSPNFSQGRYVLVKMAVKNFFNLNSESNEPLGISWEPNDVYVPSTKSTITKIGASMDEFLKKLDAADIENMAKNLNTLVVTLDESLKAANIGEMSANGNALLAEIRETNKELKKIVANPKMQDLPTKLNESLTLMSQSMNKLNAKKYPSMLLFGEAPKSSEMGKK